MASQKERSQVIEAVDQREPERANGTETSVHPWEGRAHVLDLEDFSRAEIEVVLENADRMKEILSRPIRRVPALRGRSVVNLFYEASTRTRVSFEVAAKNLGADVINVSASGSSVEKGETLLDTVRTLTALGAQVLVMRHKDSGAPYTVAQHVAIPVINAGDGTHAHPTQALLDAYTMRERFGNLERLRVLIVGDIAHSRVARSNAWGLSRLGAEVIFCGPPTLLPPTLTRPVGTRLDRHIENGSKAGLNGTGEHASAAGDNPLPYGAGNAPWPVRVEYDLDRAIDGVDVVMPLRIQFERQEGNRLSSLREYQRDYRITRARLARAAQDAIVMHPGPMNEGVEIDPDVAHGERSVVQDQVTNGVAIRMAVLYLLVASARSGGKGVGAGGSAAGSDARAPASDARRQRGESPSLGLRPLAPALGMRP